MHLCGLNQAVVRYIHQRKPPDAFCTGSELNGTVTAYVPRTFVSSRCWTLRDYVRCTRHFFFSSFVLPSLVVRDSIVLLLRLAADTILHRPRTAMIFAGPVR